MPLSVSAFNNFIDSLPQGPNKGRPRSEMSDCVLCTFTVLILLMQRSILLVSLQCGEKQTGAPFKGAEGEAQAVLLVLVCS